jgi:hypothetical protein
MDEETLPDNRTKNVTGFPYGSDLMGMIKLRKKI